MSESSTLVEWILGGVGAAVVGAFAYLIRWVREQAAEQTKLSTRVGTLEGEKRAERETTKNMVEATLQVVQRAIENKGRDK